MKIRKAWGDDGKAYNVSDCVSNYVSDWSHGEGQIERLESNISAMAKVIGLLAEAIVMKRDITTDELSRIVGYDFTVEEE